MSSFTRGAWQTEHTENIDPPRLKLLGQSDFYRDVVKPIFDRVLALILLILSSPILLVSAALARVFIGSPVIYRQTRIGLGGQPFDLYKLRTMIPDRRESQVDFGGRDRRKTHKSEDDPRVLPLGKFFRATRLDELPQLWNIIKGEMSLVGPRPELPEIVAEYEDWQHRRHDVRPGLTGLWQVSARNGKPMHECTDVDLEYVAEMSMGTDLVILIRTPVAMFYRRGY